MTQHIGIVGGGIIGLCCAYYIQKNGHQVTLFEKSGEVGSGASFANAGLISPANYHPFSTPKVWRNGFKKVFSRDADFHIKPRLSWELFQWIRAFNRHCTEDHVEKAKPFLYEMQLYSLMLYQLMELDLETTCEQTGIYFVSSTEDGFDELQNLADEAMNMLHLPLEILTPEQLQEREQNLALNCTGALYYSNDAKVRPHSLAQHMRNYLVANGATIHTQCEITQIDKKGHRLQAVIDNKGNRHECDQFVFAAGVYTDVLTKMLGMRLPLQGGKGFSFLLPKSEGANFNTPLLLLEERLLITPYNNHFRVAGGMIISGKENHIDAYQIQRMRNKLARVFSGLSLPPEGKTQLWPGLRATSPDSLPFVGRVDDDSNVIIATGHGMQGMALGAATGQIVGNIIDDKAHDLAIDLMRVDRFS